MKIAFILPSLDKKGPVIYTQYLIQGLSKKVDYIEIFYFNDIVEIDASVPTTKISFFKATKFDKFDIVHSHGAMPDLYAYKSRLGKKWVSTMHDMYERQLLFTHNFFRAKVITFLWSFALRKMKNVVVFSSALKKYYLHHIGCKNYCVIPTGVDQKKIESISKHDKAYLNQLKGKYKIIGSSGLLTKRKGYKQLIDFLQFNNDYAVVITGSGEEEESLTLYAESLGVGDRFVLLGYKKNSIDYLQYYDIFVLPSYAEGLPLSLLEAMSQNLPIVCSNLENYSDYFTTNDISLFELDNKESLSNAILKVSSDMDFYRNSSIEIFQFFFSLDAMTNSYMELYKKIIQQGENENR